MLYSYIFYFFTNVVLFPGYDFFTAYSYKCSQIMNIHYVVVSVVILRRFTSIYVVN
jgi:hypothetical protein